MVVDSARPWHAAPEVEEAKHDVDPAAVFEAIEEEEQERATSARSL